MRIRCNHNGSEPGSLIRNTFDPLFIGYCVCWPLIHYFRWRGMPIPVLNDYLTDFVFIPLVAHASLIFTRFISRKPNIIYPLHWLLIIALYVSVIFEVLLPRYSTKVVGDTGDIAAYFAGSIFYFYVHQLIFIRRY